MPRGGWSALHEVNSWLNKETNKQTNKKRISDTFLVLFSGKEYKTFYSKNKIVHYTCYSAKNVTYNS